MTLHSYFWGLRLNALVMMSAFAAVIFFINPYSLGVVAFGLFYVALFLCVTSVSALILTRLWCRSAGEDVTSAELRIAIRQGILIGILVSALIALQHMRVLVWWDALLVTAAVLLIELQFLARRT